MAERDIFLAAIDLPDPAARGRYLHQACGADAALRGRVEALLRSHDEAGSFLGEPAVVAPDPDHADTRYYVPTPDPEPLTFLAPPGRPDSLGRLGHYEVLQVLGRGGFGIVFRAFDDVLHRVVAVKVLAPHLAVTSPARKRFLREARSSARVRHENVVQVYEVAEQPLPHLVMEFIPGETLQQRLDRTGPLDVAEVVRIGRQLADGLAAAHDHGLIHRDIKPANVLLESGPRGHVKLTDFGLARAADDASLTQSGQVAGTPLYMAPEQAKGEPIDPRADLFSLGSVLYVMCSGRPPFRAPGALAVLKRVAEDDPRPIREIIPETPQWLCDLVTKLHAKNPDDRFQTAGEVADRLANHLSHVPHPGAGELAHVAGPGVANRRPRPRSLRRAAALAAGVLLALVGGLGFAEAAGVTDVRGTVIRLLSPQGTLVVEVDDPGVSVKIDGSDLVITGAGVQEIRLKPGSYTVEARDKDGKVVTRELVSVTNNGRQVVRVSQEAVAALKPPAEAPGPKVVKGGIDAAAWERGVAAMPAVGQAKAVAARLQELNPGFDGAVDSTIENGVVRGLAFRADHVLDLSPVRGLPGLRSLACSGSDAFKGQLVEEVNGAVRVRATGKSGLSDLSPLKGLPLTSLSCVNTNVYDLTPLRGMKLTTLHLSSSLVYDLSPLNGMPLTDLDFAYTKVADLAPLRGMRLTRVVFDDTPVSDLSPLKGMPLTHLGVGPGVTDLAPLKGMPLFEFGCNGAGVSDLSPLKGMPIGLLTIADTKVTDLTPLKGMTTLKRLYCSDVAADLSPLAGLPLEYLHAGPLVTDLAPLKGMPLDTLEFKTFQAERDGPVLRAIKTLKTINDRPAADFWREVESK